MLKWNVYKINHNTNQPEVFNIFNHTRFNKEMTDLLKSKNFTQKEVKDICRYYFGSKYEYELILTTFPSDKNSEEKISIYDQIIINWHAFWVYLSFEAAYIQFEASRTLGEE